MFYDKRFDAPREEWSIALLEYPDEITLIQTCGSWRHTGQTGVYRISSAAFLYGGSQLWVQWMSARDGDGWTHALHTLSPDEFNDYHAELLFDQLDCQKTDQGITIAFTADDGHEDVTHIVEVRVFREFGRYEVTKTPIRRR